MFTTVINTISTLLAIRHEHKRDHFDSDKFFDSCSGAPYMLILVLCCTNTDGLLLLPWKYDKQFKETQIFKRTGFPSEVLLRVSFLRLVEDAGQAIIQTVYISTRGAGVLTVLSMITSWLGFVYLLLFKAIVWMTSADTIQKYGLTRVASDPRMTQRHSNRKRRDRHPNLNPSQSPNAAPNFPQRRGIRRLASSAMSQAAGSP